MQKHRYLSSALFTVAAALGLFSAQQVLAATTSTPPTTGTLTVIKQVINDDGRDKVAGDFTLHVTDASSTVQTVTGNAEGTDVTIAPGAYSVAEDEDADYTASFSDECNGTIAAGETKTCTVTNDDIAPPFVATTGTLMVVKRVINDDGGTAQASDFTLYVSYQDGDGTSTQSFSGDSQGVPVVIPAGKYYEITEGENSYQSAFSADCSGTLEVGETKTCTVTNDDVLSGDLAKITIIKHVDNRYDGTKRASDFTLTLEYVAPDVQGELVPAMVSATATASFPGNEQGTSFIVAPGSFRVTEGGHAGYNVDYSAGCSGTIEGGSRVTCTVTNSDIEVPHGGPGWSPGILEPLNFPGSFSSGSGSSGSSSSGSSGGQTGQTGGQDQGQGSGSGQSSSAAEQMDSSSPYSSTYPLGTCSITEPEAYYITPDIERLLAYTGQGRDLSMEDWYNRNLVSRVVVGADETTLAAVQNFIDYGTFSNLRLGQGERAGALASYRVAYGHLPANTCDWQEVVRLANTKQPTRLVARDLAMAQDFERTYQRTQKIGNRTDAIAQSLMAYGVRPQVRDIAAENTALEAFKRIFGKLPTTTQEWDINRALAYSGLTQRWLPSSLALAQSRVMSIEGLDVGLAQAQ